MNHTEITSTNEKEIQPFSANLGPWLFVNNYNRPSYKSKCIGEFSLDENARLELGRAELKHVYERFIHNNHDINLLEGMSTQVKKRYVENLDKMFHWLMAKNAPNSSLKEALNGCEFVMRRGTLSRIATAPYDADELYDRGQKLACVKYKGAYFVRQFTEEEEILEEFQLKMTFLGRKFEQVMTTSNPHCAPNYNAIVDPNAEFNGVFKTTLKTGSNTLNILCAAEIDAICRGEFVELKTQICKMGWGRNFRHKAIKCYLQCYLIGIRRMIFGYHDDFYLKRVDNFMQTQLLPLCGREFRLAVCLAFMDHFLHKIKQELDKLPEGVILVAERAKYGREFVFDVIQADNAEVEVISAEFRAHGWRE